MQYGHDKKCAFSASLNFIIYISDKNQCLQINYYLRLSVMASFSVMRLLDSVSKSLPKVPISCQDYYQRSQKRIFLRNNRW